MNHGAGLLNGQLSFSLSSSSTSREVKSITGPDFDYLTVGPEFYPKRMV